MKLRLITSVLALTLATTSASSIFASMNFGENEQTQQSGRKRKASDLNTPSLGEHEQAQQSASKRRASGLDTPSLSDQAYDVAYNFGNFAISLGWFSFNAMKAITMKIGSKAIDTFVPLVDEDDADLQQAPTNSTSTQTTQQPTPTQNTPVETNYDGTMDSEIQVIQLDKKKQPTTTLLDLENSDSLNRALMEHNPASQYNLIQDVYMKWFQRLNERSGFKNANTKIRYYEEYAPDDVLGMQQAQQEKERCRIVLKNMAKQHPIYNVLQDKGFTHTDIMDTKEKLFLNFYNE